RLWQRARRRGLGRQLVLHHQRQSAAAHAGQLATAHRLRAGDPRRAIDFDVVDVGADRDDIDARNFVMCPGGAYDRSPCGTGTSAKLACLAADGKLAPGTIWRQAGILDSVFEGSYQPGQLGVLPRIVGTAFITAAGSLFIDGKDALTWGVTT
ncbi:MAG: proline racemase family protein, partial [Dokdonella sp.]|nr:proline racemase family protein [Dokdonella sp.]